MRWWRCVFQTFARLDGRDTRHYNPDLAVLEGMEALPSVEKDDDGP